MTNPRVSRHLRNCVGKSFVDRLFSSCVYLDLHKFVLDIGPVFWSLMPQVTKIVAQYPNLGRV